MKISEALETILNTEGDKDLSTLPQIVAKAKELEGSIDGYHERIKKLQDLNNHYLSQIPMPGEEPKAEPEEDKEPTFEEAQAELLKIMNGGN